MPKLNIGENRKSGFLFKKLYKPLVLLLEKFNLYIMKLDKGKSIFFPGRLRYPLLGSGTTWTLPKQSLTI